MGGAVSDVVSSVGDLGVSIDQTVRDTLPGGWTTAALLAAGAYYAPEIGAYITTAGETATAGSATLPANPVGFINITINGVAYKVPYYNQ